eukprot:scaffold23280_cov43-Attheya_sp.AAC.1
MTEATISTLVVVVAPRAMLCTAVTFVLDLTSTSVMKDDNSDRISARAGVVGFGSSMDNFLHVPASHSDF